MLPYLKICLLLYNLAGQLIMSNNRNTDNSMWPKLIALFFKCQGKMYKQKILKECTKVAQSCGFAILTVTTYTRHDVERLEWDFEVKT